MRFATPISINNTLLKIKPNFISEINAIWLLNINPNFIDGYTEIFYEDESNIIGIQDKRTRKFYTTNKFKNLDITYENVALEISRSSYNLNPKIDFSKFLVYIRVDSETVEDIFNDIWSTLGV